MPKKYPKITVISEDGKKHFLESKQFTLKIDNERSFVIKTNDDENSVVIQVKNSKNKIPFLAPILGCPNILRLKAIAKTAEELSQEKYEKLNELMFRTWFGNYS